ncbi:protein of unknown function [Rhodovastum atsumiense]|nr:protein of unknown function [Rhodovastum atsumiense]
MKGLVGHATSSFGNGARRVFRVLRAGSVNAGCPGAATALTNP